MHERTMVVLCIEDDPGDRALIRRAFAQTCRSTDLRLVADGEQALDYLTSGDDVLAEDDAPRPDLILLDLNMPKIDGKEVLRRIRQSPRLQTIPVVILTTSRRPEDIRECYALSANSYISKPDDFAGLERVVQNLHTYWFETVITG